MVLAHGGFKAMMSKTHILEDQFFFFCASPQKRCFFDVGPNFKILAMKISQWTTRNREKNASWGLGFRVKRKKLKSNDL